MTTKQIKSAYQRLINDVETKEFYTSINLVNRTNIYLCRSCSTPTKFRDVDPGVTPAMVNCPKCGKEAWTTNYRDIAPHIKPTFEWYRPSLAYVLKIKDSNPGMVEHVLDGGLIMRDVKPEVYEIPGWIHKEREFVLKEHQERIKRFQELISSPRPEGVSPGILRAVHQDQLESLVDAVEGIHPDSNYWKQRCLLAEAMLQASANSDGSGPTEAEIAYGRFIVEHGLKE